MKQLLVCFYLKAKDRLQLLRSIVTSVNAVLEAFLYKHKAIFMLNVTKVASIERIFKTFTFNENTVTSRGRYCPGDRVI